ncbi:hypothetical protein UNPA324_32760 [Bradyrhizobium sp. UNPA324]|nr:hypothetical protein UNPA324_32760 [Bradyrhizobium sp. UNPA324]
MSVLSMLSVPSFTSVDRQRGFMVGWSYVGRGTGIVMSRMTATTKAVIARFNRAIQYSRGGQAGVEDLALAMSAAAYWMPRPRAQCAPGGA